MGTFINKHLYDQLPEGVADELRRVNPCTQSGRHARKHHQHLTVDTGNEHLDKQILTVTTLMQVADGLDQFNRFFEKRFPSRSERQILRFTEGPDRSIETLFEDDRVENN